MPNRDDDMSAEAIERAVEEREIALGIETEKQEFGPDVHGVTTEELADQIRIEFADEIAADEAELRTEPDAHEPDAEILAEEIERDNVLTEASRSVVELLGAIRAEFVEPEDHNGYTTGVAFVVDEVLGRIEPAMIRYLTLSTEEADRTEALLRQATELMDITALRHDRDRLRIEDLERQIQLAHEENNQLLAALRDAAEGVDK